MLAKVDATAGWWLMMLLLTGDRTGEAEQGWMDELAFLSTGWMGSRVAAPAVADLVLRESHAVST